LAYLFGSAARGKMGPLSDVDIAVLFSKKVKKEKYFDKQLNLASEIDKALKIYKTEVICLNEAPPLLKHRAVFFGIPIFISNSKLKREFEFKVLQE
jgi:predicted nucleotidyltransferase